MEPRSAERGNELEVKQSCRRRLASMEPRSAERGNLKQKAKKRGVKVASMEPRSAERGNRQAGLVFDFGERRFNGATLSRTWKRQDAAAADGVPVELQWSHAQPNVETRHLPLWGGVPPWASMEPRSAERGNDRDRELTLARQQSFNGATLSRTWKPAAA